MLVEYLEILTSPAHMAVEFTFVLLDYLVIQFVVRRWSKRRDRLHNHKED